LHSKTNQGDRAIDINTFMKKEIFGEVNISNEKEPLLKQNIIFLKQKVQLLLFSSPTHTHPPRASKPLTRPHDKEVPSPFDVRPICINTHTVDIPSLRGTIVI